MQQHDTDRGTRPRSREANVARAVALTQAEAKLETVRAALTELHGRWSAGREITRVLGGVKSETRRECAAELNAVMLKAGL
jgi:hypothetical protein